MSKKALLAAALSAAAIAGASAGAAFAGEVTGSGQNEDQNQGKSWCSFSGLNDGNPPAGQAQSFGQDVSAGRADPSEQKGGSGSPGTECNPNNTSFPPQPNRDK